MQKLYFETEIEFTKFIKLCQDNHISHSKPFTKGKLSIVIIDDNLTNDEFLYNNGY